MTTIFINTQFEGMHHWPAAPEGCRFLAALHRHIFHVRVEMPVTHNDRDIEFVQFKRQVNSFIATVMATEDTKTWSCETWAATIRHHFAAYAVTVSEDGENGATVRKDTR